MVSLNSSWRRLPLLEILAVGVLLSQPEAAVAHGIPAAPIKKAWRARRYLHASPPIIDSIAGVNYKYWQNIVVGKMREQRR